MSDEPTAGKKLFDTLQGWCDGHGVTIVLDSTLGLGAQFSSEDPKAPMLMVKSSQDEPVMLHEACHAYFYFRQQAGGLPAEAVARLDAAIRFVRDAEPKLPVKEQDALARIFGPLSSYTNAALSPTPTDYSFIGNLVDESRTTTTTVSDREGHPMDNFDEFCASLSATAAYGDFGAFSKQMRAFQKAGAENPQIAPLYNSTVQVLSAAVPLVSGYASQLRAANGFGPEPPELMKMELNLAKMSGLLQELQAVSLSAEKTPGLPAKR
ncbi:MAG: hypothetical protein KGH63_04490 [Candidatus Micrarchaeota archaeon]|nr:hypothetical protein [Candidatus Micrarchaeota archaeon]